MGLLLSSGTCYIIHLVIIIIINAINIIILITIIFITIVITIVSTIIVLIRDDDQLWDYCSPKAFVSHTDYHHIHHHHQYIICDNNENPGNSEFWISEHTLQGKGPHQVEL